MNLLGPLIGFSILNLGAGTLVWATSTKIVDCPQPFKSYHDIVLCAQQRSPAIIQQLSIVEKAKSDAQVAEQWPNPDFSSESFYGNKQDNAKETDLALSFRLEVGGKRSARKNLASSRIQTAEADLRLIQIQTTQQVLRDLFKARQLFSELDVLTDVIHTYQQLVRQYSKRPLLSPEQKISLNVFQMAQSEFEIKKATCVDKLHHLDASFQLNIGQSTQALKALLGTLQMRWPKVSPTSLGLKESAEIQLTQAELNSAHAAMKLTQKEIIPDILVGPSLKLLDQSGQTSTMYGFNLQLKLPILNTYQGERKAAAQEIETIQLRQSLLLQEQQLQRQKWVAIYNNSVQTLEAILSNSEIRHRHKEIDALFLRGIVPSTLVIEAHRTWVELEFSKNQRELKSLEALLNIYSLDGQSLENIL